MPRTRYRWDPELKELVEVSPDWAPTPRMELMTGSFYEGTISTDGVPIDTRKRHSDYMRANDLAMASDFKNVIAKEKAKREAVRAGQYDIKQNRAATEAAWTQVFDRRGK